jgi:CDP-diacylglycerol--glycerol-3-phosphate 3-phosphatidyltransferase
MVAVLIGRDFAVTALRSRAYSRGIAMPASPLGKVKMIAQVVAILALILGRDELQGFFVIGEVALWVALVAAIISAADYVRRFNQLPAPTTRVANLGVGDPRADRRAG